ncbi:hypothetical protein Nmel_010824, partial [Mimus melanotis]
VLIAANSQGTIKTALAAVVPQPGATQLLLAGDLIPFLPQLEDPLCFKLKLLWQS